MVDIARLRAPCTNSPFTHDWVNHPDGTTVCVGCDARLLKNSIDYKSITEAAPNVVSEGDLDKLRQSVDIEALLSGQQQIASRDAKRQLEEQRDAWAGRPVTPVPQHEDCNCRELETRLEELEKDFDELRARCDDILPAKQSTDSV